MESSQQGENYHHHSSFNNHHQAFTDSSGWNRFPKIEVNKFNGSDPAGWVSQMEHYFSLHNITDDMAKLRVAVLYLDFERWQWWQWYKKAYGGYIAWTQFAKAVTTHFDRESHFLGRLTKLRQADTVDEFIASFEQLAIRTEGLSNAFHT